MSTNFQKQFNDFKELKEKLKNAGYIYGDRFDIPLMVRMGHKINLTQKNRDKK
jgi:hypothetical protein